MSFSSQSIKKPVPPSLARADAQASLPEGERHEEQSPVTPVTKTETILGQSTASQPHVREQNPAKMTHEHVRE